MPILRNTLENWKIYFVNSFIFWTTPEKDLLKVHRILMNYMTQGNSIYTSIVKKNPFLDFLIFNDGDNIITD